MVYLKIARGIIGGMISRAINAIGRRINPAWAWNRQYAAGLTYPKSQLMAQYVESLAAGGNVVELGCGDGALAASVKPECFSHWTGWDISSEAIGRAKKRNVPHTDWIADNIADFKSTPRPTISLVIIEEALYYLSDDQQRHLLEECIMSLAPDGTIIITTHDAEKHRGMIENCLATAPSAKIEKHGQRTYIFIK